ncbi:WhiB family transcriptional regulator [Streptomyces sp. NPDC056987]|uniref:WhiB family transcriptional regulator n=1 Tax=Streptomyces sp. NPDC056987 TaxID=3345988 RepID=UPI00362B4887
MSTLPITAQQDIEEDGDTWAWLRYAACADADPELFFPVGESGPAVEQVERAKQVCHACPVESQCLAWALSTERTTGVWGGTDEAERRRLRRRADRRRSPRSRPGRGESRARGPRPNSPS